MLFVEYGVKMDCWSLTKGAGPERCMAKCKCGGMDLNGSGWEGRVKRVKRVVVDATLIDCMREGPQGSDPLSTFESQTCHRICANGSCQKVMANDA